MSASGDVPAERDLEWLSLEDDETIVWAGGPDRRTLVPTLAIGIPLSIVLIGILIIVGEYLRVRNTVYVITDEAIYRKTGVLSRDVKRIDHEKVQDISYSQSALGSAFGYGTVELTTAGGAGVEMAFRSVTDPRTVQQRISEQVARHSDSGQGEDDVLDEILAELRAIREAVEDAGGYGDVPTVEGERLIDPDSDSDSEPAHEPDSESEPERRAPVRRERPPDGGGESMDEGDEREDVLGTESLEERSTETEGGLSEDGPTGARSLEDDPSSDRRDPPSDRTVANDERTDRDR